LSAGIVTWDGEAGDRKWSTPLNWSTNTPPAIGDDAVIPSGAGEVHLDVAFTVERQLTVGGSGTGTATLIVKSGVTLTVNGDALSLDGCCDLPNLVIEPPGTLINHGTIAGTGRQANVSLRGALVNNGTMDDISVEPSSSFSTFTNAGLLAGGSSVFMQGGTFENDGTFNPADLFLRFGTVNNNAGGTMRFTGTEFGGAPNALSIDGGELNNYGTIVNTNTIRNSATFNNHGLLDNTAGTLRISCDLTGNTFVAGTFVNSGSYLGGPISEDCKVWDNDSGSGLWSDPRNWSGDALPEGDDVVVISGEAAGPATVLGDVFFTASAPGRLVIGHETDTSELVVVPARNFSVLDLDLRRNGALRIVNSGKLTAGRIEMKENAALVNDGLLTSTGPWTVTGSSASVLIDNQDTWVNSGTLSVASRSGTFTLKNSGTIHNAGSIITRCADNPVYELTGLILGTGTVALCNVWTGAAGDRRWSNASNWETGRSPASMDDFVIPAGAGEVHLDSDFTLAYQLTVGRGPGTGLASLIVDDGVTLTVNGDALSLDGCCDLSNLVIEPPGTLINHGTITETGRQANVWLSGALVNNGTMDDISVEPSSFSTFTNAGLLAGGSSVFMQGGTFENDGTFNPADLFLRFGTVNNNAGGTMRFTGTGFGGPNALSIDGGVLNNYGTIVNANAARNGGTLKNYGHLDTSLATFNNVGTLTKECGSILVGTISGNPPVEFVCAGLSLSLTAPATVLPGATFSYVIDVFNGGPATAERVVVTDQLPTGASLLSTVVRTAFCTVEGGVTSCGGSVDIEACLQTGATVACSLGDLPDGGTGQVTLTVQLAAGVIGTLTNRAAVSTTSTDSDPSNDTATATTEVADTIPPSISCPADIGIANDSGQAHATVSYSAMATDNAPGVTVACAPPAGSSLPLGSTGVTCTATDAAGNTASCSFAVTVTDTEPPVVACPANLTVPNDPGQANAVVDYTMATATDNAPGGTVVSSPPSGSVFPLGTTSVAATATDAAGNTATCSFTVTVNDTEPPVPACPADVTAPNDAGQATAVVAYAATATDNAPGVTVACSPPSGSPFPVGATSVTCTATDAAGNTGSCSFALTVDDVEPPVVAPPPDRTAEATSPAGAVVSDADLGVATAMDNVPGVTVTRTGVPAGNVFPLGVTDITYTATDAAGNTATATQRVTVRDTTPPTITISSPAATTYTLNQAVLSDYTCTDAVSAVTSCAGPVPSGSNFDTGSVGSKMFAVSAADAAGNAATPSVSYSVGYGVCLLYDPSRAVRAGGTLPIKIQLCDAAGANVSASMLVVTALQLVKLSDATTATVEDTGNANPDGNFRYDPAVGGTGGYIFNLSTAGLTTGTYALVWSATGDATRHGSEVIFQVK
jgi:uncharacterized repeat protein (TIGR01451 family)